MDLSKMILNVQAKFNSHCLMSSQGQRCENFHLSPRAAFFAQDEYEVMLRNQTAVCKEALEGKKIAEFNG